MEHILEKKMMVDKNKSLFWLLQKACLFNTHVAHFLSLKQFDVNPKIYKSQTWASCVRMKHFLEQLHR